MITGFKDELDKARVRHAKATAAKAADILETMGWCQGINKDDQGHFCLIGALDEATDHHFPLYQNTVIDIQAFYGLSEKDRDLVSWNDKPERTKDEVISFLRKYAEAEDA